MLPGRPEPLGATWDGSGVNFAIVSERATSVDLCLFDAATDARERARVPLAANGPGTCSTATCPGSAPDSSTAIACTVRGIPNTVSASTRPKSCSIPTRARSVAHPWWHPALLAYAPGSEGDGPADPTDSAPYAPLGAVLDPAFDWGGDQPLRTSWPETVIYELHVKGFSAQNPAVPPEWRGTYLGVAAPASIDHLRALGVTAVELLPIHAHANEPALERRGLTNYWGYNTVGYFAPEPTLRHGAVTSP